MKAITAGLVRCYRFTRTLAMVWGGERSNWRACLGRLTSHNLDENARSIRGKM